ncbi:MAG: ATP-binding protein [Nanoarchaeota archaeon]
MVKLKESESVELKKSTGELKEAVISIAAILNKHPKGKLYFGIKNDGAIVGQDVTENTLREISKTISEHIEPRIYPKIEKIIINGKKGILVNFEGSEKPYFAYGRSYIRVSDEDRQLSAKELENMIVKKNEDKLRWDRQICRDALLKDVDTDTIKRFVGLAKKAKRMKIEDDDSKIILEKLELLKESHLTNAAVLVFGVNPDRFFHVTKLRCERFKGDSQQFVDMKDFDGNLFQILDGAMRFFQDHLQIRAKIKGLLRVETWEIPLEVLREAVLNALIHRDYKGDSFVYIKIYDDSVEISNPGELPDEIKISDLYKPHLSKLKNPLIAKVFYLAGYIDTWGQGILNIIKLLKENNLSLPIFEQTQGSFRIKFKREYVSETREKSPRKVPEKSQKILAVINENPHISRKELSLKLSERENTIQSRLRKLIKEGFIKRIGPDKGGHWEIIEK